MKPSSLEFGIWVVNLVINNNSNKDVVPELLLSSLLPSFLKFREIHQLPIALDGGLGDGKRRIV
jgi:hypothetical protein